MRGSIVFMFQRPLWQSELVRHHRISIVALQAACVVGWKRVVFGLSPGAQRFRGARFVGTKLNTVTNFLNINIGQGIDRK